MIVVVDSSVVVKWYVNEDHTLEAERLIDSSLELHAPELLLAEFGNIIWKKLRNQDIDEQLANFAIESIAKLTIVLHSHPKLIRSAYTMAVETGTSVYDWIYLSLALSLSCKFVTADRKFFLAMRKTKFKSDVVWIENIPQLI